MIRNIEEFLKDRRRVLYSLIILLTIMLIVRLFVLQVIRGADFQDNYKLKVERKEIIEATRGNIYDKNGNILAYNKLAHTVTIEDIGSYKNDDERNNVINSQLLEVIRKLKENGEELYLDFGIYMDSSGNFVFRDSGTGLTRFRADIFGYADPSQLKVNEKTGIDEANADAKEIMSYLCDRRYDIPKDYSKAERFEIAVIRYHMGLNTYQKYISTPIAKDVSEKSVAYIMENKYRFTGIDVEDKSIRAYPNAKCFANILGYTGTISTEEYNELSKTDDSYTLNDTVGKSGIEQYMNKELMGKSGYQTVYVDSLGNLLETAEVVNQESGNDVYLSIDRDLTETIYNLLEQQIASILHSKIINAKEYDENSAKSRDDILIPIYDVYYALINNRVINISKTTDLSDAEELVYNQFNTKFDSAIEEFGNQLKASYSTPYESLPEEYQAYSTYLVKKLKRDEIFDSNLIDTGDENQILWTSEKLSVNDYIRYAIEKEWIKIDGFVREYEYVDSAEVYSKLVDYSIEQLKNDDGFRRLVYRHALLEDRINLGALLAILYDQGVLEEDIETRNALISGSMDTYSFIMEKIGDISITPGQLGLDPCSGSCVVIDPNTGEVLALVSYPGYDSNRLSNSLDSEYYGYLNTNEASPLYNHATQEKTAPGSTFKMISAAAGLGEGVISPEEKILDEGKFLKVSNEPKCWIYPGGTHGEINIKEAIRDSCNYYFYELGWRLSGGESFNDRKGINSINQYAKSFGLGDKTGVEIEESSPNLASEYPVMAAIGQSDSNFTTIGLARYVAAVANSGNVYDLTLLSHVEDPEGNVIDTFEPILKNNVENVSYSSWAAIHEGMRLVVENLNVFSGFPITVAGKTGTAQQSATRPNHALFVGYAPYEAPQIAIACRISNGYTSHNAADFAKLVLAKYFETGDYTENSGVRNIESNNRITD